MADNNLSLEAAMKVILVLFSSY